MPERLAGVTRCEMECDDLCPLSYVSADLHHPQPHRLQRHPRHPRCHQFTAQRVQELVRRRVQGEGDSVTAGCFEDDEDSSGQDPGRGEVALQGSVPFRPLWMGDWRTGRGTDGKGFVVPLS